ncbi:hypothetical protein WJX84_000553, partial [Apatococcus fuscideae]
MPAIPDLSAATAPAQVTAEAAGPGQGSGRRGPRRGRGGRPPTRPAAQRVARAQRLPPGTQGLPVNHWSVTIAVRGGDVPSGWADRAASWGVSFCEKYAMSFELGGRIRRLHLQGCIQIRSNRDEAYAAVLVKHLKTYIPILPGAGGTVSFVPFGDTQTWSGMLGYVQKDAGQGHYELRTHAISDAELAEGRMTYNTLRLDYEEGKIALAKTSLFKVLYREWYTQLRPLDVEVDRLLLWMLQTGRYTPSSTWITTPNGSGINFDQARAMWKVCREPETIDLSTVHNLFFHDRFKRRGTR